MAERFIRQLSSFRDRYVAAEAIRRAPDGYVCEVRQATRSLEQNARLHAMLSDVSRQVIWYGQKLGVEDWKRIFCAALQKVRVVPGIDPGSFVPVGLRTRDMTVSELGDLMTLIEAFGAEHSVIFKDPRADTPVPMASTGETPGAFVSRADCPAQTIGSESTQ